MVRSSRLPDSDLHKVFTIEASVAEASDRKPTFEEKTVEIKVAAVPAPAPVPAPTAEIGEERKRPAIAVSENAAEKEEETSEKAPKRQKEDEGGPFDKLAETMREAIAAAGASMKGDPAVERCARTSLARFQRQMFYEWTSMTTGRGSVDEVRECERRVRQEMERQRTELIAELLRWESVIVKHGLAVPISADPRIVRPASSDDKIVGTAPALLPLFSVPSLALKDGGVVSEASGSDFSKAVRSVAVCIDKIAPLAAKAKNELEGSERVLPGLAVRARDVGIAATLGPFAPALPRSIIPEAPPVSAP